MKLIHCADIHLGSTLSSLPKELVAERKSDVRTSFVKMVEYACDKGIGVILLSGDVFDRQRPTNSELEFFYNVVSKHSDIDFLYLRGNHDYAGELRQLPNLKSFTDKWRTYSYGDVTVSGIEISPSNALSYISTLSLEPEKKNIVMLHGQVGDDINVTNLRDKYIDYLALGHIHSYVCKDIDRRGVYVYSGCLEGRGFDEIGEKGFVILDTDGNGITHTFCPFSKKIIEVCRVDISGLSDSYSVVKKVKDTVNLQDNGIYRLILMGEVDGVIEGLEADVTGLLRQYCGHLSVKDETRVRINYDIYQNDRSIKGEVVRLALESGRSDEEKEQIIRYALMALSGEKPE